ncbi:LysR family transcriptional regulator [Thalassospira mesophila]|uniref:LysR family transcriptional regulator n=1 Tax=Thalassospira mesophila TaxID=1293891 RepID=A0A1Y2KYI2_9PROT|nr:LysR family transcriptional regulator [Thalassospira mesophila]OSQ36087.1 LysR family transcriptional regulator [Thalassospira mesophila]
MNWDDLRFFLVLAQEGTLSGAARRLRKEHTTVARRVEALEQSVGTKLFDRMPGGWRLTPDGQQLVPLAERVEVDALAFERMANSSEIARGVVRISVPPVAGRILFAPRLAALLAEYKGLEFELIGSSHVANLARREADIAVRMVTPTEPGLIAQKLAELGVGLYGAHDYVANIAEENWELCGYDDTSYGLAKADWVRRLLGRDILCRLRANDTASVQEFVAAGLGVAVLPRYLGDMDKRLTLIREDEKGESREPIWIVVHPDMRRSPRVRLVMNALIDAVHEIAQEFQL